MIVKSTEFDGLTVNTVTGQIKRYGQPLKVRTDNRYPYVRVSINGHKVMRSCHRLVVETITGNHVNGTIHHCNHDRSDYRPSNLAVISRNTHNIIEYNGLQVEGNIL